MQEEGLEDSMPSQCDSPQRDSVSGKLSQQKKGWLGRPGTRRQGYSLLGNLPAMRRKRTGRGEKGGQGDLLGIIGDVTQKPFLLPSDPHVLLTVNSVHTRPCTPPRSFSQFQSPNGRAYIPGALCLSRLLLQCSSSPCCESLMCSPNAPFTSMRE